MRLSDGFLQEVKYKNDIEDVIARYVTLQRKGNNLLACCPFHSEKTPSFTVNKARQFFYCFGCGAGGDVVTFMMKIENAEYLDAIARLAEFAKMEMPEDDRDTQGQPIIKRSRILEMNRAAALFFHESLINSPQAEAAREYIARRALKGATVKRFGLGYSPGDWGSLTRHLSDLGYSKEEQKAAGLISLTQKGNYIDYFRDRLMFPIIDVGGHVIAFGGRAISADDRGPKYLNSADTQVFKKSRQLYALNFAKNAKEDYFILCEGYMDVISMHQAGFSTAVATLGTAVTADQARLIEKYAKRVVLAYDSDEAGRRAMQKAAMLLGEVGIDVSVLELGEAKDPDEFINKYGREKLAEYLTKPKGYVESRIEAALLKYNLSIPMEAQKAINEACAEIAKIKERITRELYAGHLAEKFKVMPETFFAKIEDVRKRQQASEQREREKKFQEQLREERVRVNPEEAIIGALLNHPEFYREVKSDLSEEFFSEGLCKRVFSVLSGNYDSGENFGIIDLNRDFTADEIGKITRMRLSESVKLLNRTEKLKNHIDMLIHKKSAETYDSIMETVAESTTGMLEGIDKIREKKFAH